VSQSIPPTSSSDFDEAAPEPEPGEGVGLRSLVGRLADEFGAGPETMASVASVFREVRERAPDLFIQAAGGLAEAFNATAASKGADTEPVYVAIGEWALDAESEPIERMRRDCLRFQAAMMRGVLRLYAADHERCTERMLALQRLNFLQLALLASLASRSQEGGGVVRTLPTPEYATFMDIFRNAIEAQRAEGSQLALLLLQVEKVDQVDRQLGLQKGEAFMLRVTRRMREGILRKQDQLGRVSRDQFACLLPRVAGEGVAILAANKILDALEAPIPLGDRAFDPDAVIGIVMFPVHGEDPQTLVRNAKLAARAARKSGERAALYDPEQGEDEERKMLYEVKLRGALDENQLSLIFELQLDLGSGRIGGMECLLDWKDKEFGKVPEAQAMAAAASAGIVRELTWWIFDNALRQSAEFARAGLECPISIKVTTDALLQPDFPEFVGRSLRTWDVPPKRLVIGIHESALSGGLGPVQETLSRLKSFGLRLEIDGFGTGSSSLSNLAQLPLDELKVSGEFVRDMREVALHAKIVRSVIRLARDLGLRVAAEGVDDAETALALSSLGCERVQGEYVSPPLTAQEIIAFERHTAGLANLPLSDV
jgi:diguanylate cyclase (GGDEF)-like protein